MCGNVLGQIRDERQKFRIAKSEFYHRVKVFCVCGWSYTFIPQVPEEYLSRGQLAYRKKVRESLAFDQKHPNEEITDDKQIECKNTEN
jgi:hypothetical protein